MTLPSFDARVRRQRLITVGVIALAVGCGAMIPGGRRTCTGEEHVSQHEREQRVRRLSDERRAAVAIAEGRDARLHIRLHGEPRQLAEIDAELAAIRAEAGWTLGMTVLLGVVVFGGIGGAVAWRWPSDARRG